MHVPATLTQAAGGDDNAMRRQQGPTQSTPSHPRERYMRCQGAQAAAPTHPGRLR